MSVLGPHGVNALRTVMANRKGHESAFTRQDSVVKSWRRKESAARLRGLLGVSVSIVDNCLLRRKSNLDVQCGKGYSLV